jgi:hypothetical protein
MRRSQNIPQRRRIFLGCEGESERSYGALLGRLVEVRHRRLYLDNILLQPGCGDPLALVERAVKLMRQRVNQRGDYVAKALLLDHDTCGRSKDRDRQAHALAKQHGLRLIWQEPCHEGLLLRHLNGCSDLRPATCDQAVADLRRHWPEYRKAMPASQLALRIGEDAVRRAAVVEDVLRAFLDDIEFGRD